MTDTSTEPGTVDSRDEEWLFTIYHSAYYQWEPIKEDDLTFTPEAEGAPAYWTENATKQAVIVVDSYYPGFKMVRRTINEPTTSTSGVHVPSMERTNANRVEAGLSPRTVFQNAIRELEDGTWPRQFPITSITKVEVLQGPSDLQAQINAYLGLESL